MCKYDPLTLGPFATIAEACKIFGSLLIDCHMPTAGIKRFSFHRYEYHEPCSSGPSLVSVPMEVNQ